MRGITLLGLLVLWCFCALGYGQEPPASSPAPAPQDAPAPEPILELKPLLEEVKQLSASKKYAETLERADALFQQAQAKGDTIGQAYALRFRARALQELYQSAPEKLPEVAAVWASAYTLWQQIGDEAYQVEALLGQAYCLGRTAPDQTEALIAQGLALAHHDVERPLALLQILHEVGARWIKQNQLQYAARVLQPAQMVAERLAPRSVEFAKILHGLGLIAYYQNDLGASEQLFQRALAILEDVAPNSRELAVVLDNLGGVVRARRDFETAEQLVQRSLTILKRLNPISVEVAIAYNNLAYIAYEQRQYDLCAQRYRRALAVHEALDPNSAGTARTLFNLADVLSKQGNLEESLQLYQRALAIYEQIAPNSADVAKTLNNLGQVMWSLGDLGAAEEYYQRALLLYDRVAPDSLSRARTLNNLGNVLRERGDLQEAEKHYRSAFAIFERLSPDSLEATRISVNLGLLAQDQRDFAVAERYFQRALAAYERLAPDSLEMARLLLNLGHQRRLQGNLAAAAEFYRRALSLSERLAPNSFEVAVTAFGLGRVAQHQGDLESAARWYQRALATVERLAPDALLTADILKHLASLARQQQRYSQAQRDLARALAIYEIQRFTIQDPETRAAFAGKHFDAYTLQAQLALDQRSPAQAALALERSRARTLAEQLHMRAPPIPQNAPRALRDLIAQHEQLQREYLLLARQQRQADPSDPKALQHLRAHARALADRRRAIDQQLRNQFPAYAQLFNPTAPSLSQIQAALAPNTVLLYHAFASDELLIVAVGRQAVRGYRVRVDPDALEQEILRFQRIVAKPPAQRTAQERTSLLVLGRRLYEVLIKPAEASLKNARVVLLCPEGVLNQLPWGALVASVDKRGRPTYWVERAAVTLALSAGVYLQAQATRPALRGVAIAAVSQYRGRQTLQASFVEQRMRRSHRALNDLPAVKQEVAQVQRLLRALGVAAVREGDATPERVRKLAQAARVVHLACHARANGDDPLGSELLLAPAGSDEGTLTAAEVVSRWQLRADVVMLSACETAVGVVHRYEGMYGLARAFLYAGARSVGASLWQVEDVSTAQLMSQFYRAYIRGVGKAEALRRAQVSLIRSREYADPYYWSGFMLMGAP
jgi:CHAT domain-containing protein/tetratricopeptide (TPR) repeat protein